MRNPIFDYDDGDLILPVSDNMGIDSNGHINYRIGDNLSVDMETGQLHITSNWKTDDDDDR